jgi:ech hydrogenase subunit A
MTLELLLILGPFAVGAALFCTRSEVFRRILVGGAVLAAFSLSIALAMAPAPVALNDLPVSLHRINLGMLLAETAMSLFILYIGLRAKRPLIVLLTLAQAGLMTWFELGPGAHLEVAQNLAVDKFSVLMALINGIVGGGICLYALGYMREYHEKTHSEVPDRRPLFFGLLFIFMGAMFGLVFANNLTWLFLFWEITTLCSFLLIGYTQTEEASRNALRALVMNLAGGLAFALAIVILHQKTGNIELQALIARGLHGEADKLLVLLPAALLCFAGITKSAQLPFSGWLLGAMVAPTPVSALLHSSTMVKAGVYLILRLAPVMTGTGVGLLVALVGGITFVVGSLAAICTSDAKRVLAYSTVANLGLIVMCGGVGTPGALWAGMLLIVFHAVAKCLLFLCVGVVQHKLHSRDIEDMSGLVQKMPRLSVMMQIGMAGMFLAPFGMLISKWAVLKAMVDVYPLLALFIVYGSAATLFFWVKWMGKLIEVVKEHESVERDICPSVWGALTLMSVLTVGTCLFFPLLSKWLVEPYVITVLHHTAGLGSGNIIIMLIMFGMLALFPLSFFLQGRGSAKKVDAYLGGANTRDFTSFVGSGGGVQEIQINNYYFGHFLAESTLFRCGVLVATVVLAALTAAVLI